MIKLGIAEDNKQFREALKKLIQTEKDIEIILEADNGRDLIEKLKDVQPEIILMDIRMPLMNGIEASLILSQLYPSIKIIAFSQYDIEANIIEMNVRGVMSFIGKEDEPEVLLKAIRVVNDGGVYMTAKSAEIVQNYLRSFSKKNKLSSDLSPTEIVILRAICKGQSSTDIGKLVNKSHRTVEKYRNELYQKLNVADKKQLISLVSEWSILK